jgi:hypothetical protein
MSRSVKAKNRAAASLQLSVKDESADVEEALPINVAALGGGGLLLFGGVSWFLQLFLNHDKCSRSRRPREQTQKLRSRNQS